MANLDPILAAGLAAMIADRCELVLCAREPGSASEAKGSTFACKENVEIKGPFHRAPSGMSVQIASFVDGRCEASGRVSHWALCGASGLWATGPLEAPLDVYKGALFEFPELSINLPGA